MLFKLLSECRLLDTCTETGTACRFFLVGLHAAFSGKRGAERYDKFAMPIFRELIGVSLAQ